VSLLLEAILAALILVGGAFALLGSFGLARLPDFFMRLHGPTKATTLGVGAVVLAAVLHGATAGEEGGGLRELAVVLFLLITAPITAHMLAKAALAEERRRRRAAAGAERGAAEQGAADGDAAGP
jgi:multicomponent K+:H+ antiporter subunit G